MVLDERRLAQIWQAQWLTAGLRTTEGTPVEVVYRGVWTHRQGPDFAGSLLVIGHQLLEGDVELHLAASDWYAHGHHDDPAYDRVILHGVWRDDLGRPVQRRDGRSIPTLVLADYLPGELAAFPVEPIRSLGALGFTHCAPEIAKKEPQRLLRLFARAGDERLRDKVRRVHARLTGEPPEQTLYWLLADALGYSKNREGMRALAEALPLIELEARLRAQKPDERFTTAAAWLFGLGGFLPASPRERALLPLPPNGVQIPAHLDGWYQSGDRRSGTSRRGALESERRSADQPPPPSLRQPGSARCKCRQGAPGRRRREGTGASRPASAARLAHNGARSPRTRAGAGGHRQRGDSIRSRLRRHGARWSGPHPLGGTPDTSEQCHRVRDAGADLRAGAPPNWPCPGTAGALTLVLHRLPPATMLRMSYRSPRRP